MFNGETSGEGAIKRALNEAEEGLVAKGGPVLVIWDGSWHDGGRGCPVHPHPISPLSEHDVGFPSPRTSGW